MNPQNNPNKVIVHHSADSEPGHQLDKINQWHKERGFNLSSLSYYVGYHFLIEKDGTVTQTRNTDEMGCHCIGENFSSIGICLAGNFDIELPTPEQEVALGGLLETLCAEFHIDSTMIFPHRNFSLTDCYGKQLKPSWAMDIYLAHIGEITNQQQPCAISPQNL